MSVLTKAEASMLRHIQKEMAWDVVLRMLKRRTEELAEHAGAIEGNDAFETLRGLHRTQGGIAELKQFFEDIERNAFE